MKILKQAIKKVLRSFGYELLRNTEQVERERVERFDNNFANLAKAYEQRLNESNDLILENELRPNLLALLLGTPPSEAYFIIQALAKCKNIKGDVCEFGVAQGETSALIANEIALSSDKLLHLFNSFEGLPKPTERDILKDDIGFLGSMEAYEGTMSCPKDMVLARLKAISFPPERYVIHKGFFEQLIHKDNNLPKEISFAYVDFDFYKPTKLALDFLHSRTTIGAIITVDDYDFFTTGVKAAVDEFVEEKNSGKIIYEYFVPNIQYGHFVVLTKKG